MHDVRNRDERGVAMVLFGIAATVLIGAVGLSVDVGNMVLQDSRVQNAVDSAALAIAQDCALNKPACSDATGTANSYAIENAGGADVRPFAPGSNAVTVAADKAVPTIFLRLLDVNSSDVTASATASWTGYPIEGAPVLPFGAPLCALQNHLPPATTPFVLRSNMASALFFNAKNTTITKALQNIEPMKESCTSTASGPVTMLNGLIWLNPPKDGGDFHWNSSACNMKVPSIEAIINTENSAGIPAQCMSKFGSRIRAGSVVMTPIYAPSAYKDQYGLDRGTDGGVDKPTLKVEIIGFAPFKITGWNMKKEGGGSQAACSVINLPKKELDCEGISGYFVKSVQADPDFTYSPDGKNFGAFDVRLSD